MAQHTKRRTAGLAACLLALSMFMTACGDDEPEGGDETGGDVTLCG